MFKHDDQITLPWSGWANRQIQPGNIACPGVSTFFGSYLLFAAWTVGQTGP